LAAFVDPREPELAVLGVAASQHGVFGVRQAVAVGLGGAALRGRCAAHRLHRIHRGVYGLVPESLLTTNGRRMAAVLACGPGAVLSHQAAAALHCLMRAGGARLDITVPSRGGRGGHTGVVIHRSSTLRPHDVTVVAGIPCTTVARTLFDLAELLPRRWLERLLDEACVLEVFDLSALREQITNGGGRHGAAGALQCVLREHAPGSTATDGEIGERMLAIIRSVDVPAPEVQAWLDLGDGEPMIRPDFLWRAARVILETDGGLHRRGRRVAEDVRRDQRSARAGWQTLRATWAQITNEPVRLGATLLAVVSSRSLAATSLAATATGSGATAA
jgi:hypothetical protein